jgi:prolyl oligopeptidase
MRNFLVLFSAAVLFAQPPQAKRVPTRDDFHGTLIEEDYRWLENPDSKDTRAWIEAENDYTRAFFSRIDQMPRLRASMERLWRFDRTPVASVEDGTRAGYFHKGGKLFFLRQAGLQNQPMLYVQAPGKAAAPEVLLDPNALNADGTAALNTFTVSPDGKYLAYAISRSGSDWVTWRVRSTTTRTDLPDLLEWSKFSSAEWDARGTGFYYGRFPKPEAQTALQAVNENYKLYFHKLNTPQSDDTLVYERPDYPRWRFSPHATSDGRYLILTINESTSVQRRLYYRDLSKPGSKFEPLVDEFFCSLNFLGNRGPKFYVTTDYNAPKSRIIELDIASPARDKWRTVVAEAPDAIKQSEMAGDEFVISYMHDVSGLVKIAPLSNPTAARQVPLPPNSSITLGLDSASIFSVTGFLTPETIYTCEGGSCRPLPTGKLPFDPSLFETRQVFYESTGGARIPMFLVHRKGLKLDGENPALLYAYGGFNVSVTPAFSPLVIAWLEQGGVYAVPNLRGGGEYGEQWHRGGMLQNKQNVFDDYIHAAEWLIANKYTSSRRLAIYGRSNGGLLVGAVLNQRPELFAAAIPAVGVMDMLRFDQYTIGYAWASEYGSPKNLEDFRIIRKYSPLHNIVKGTKYPPTLILTADHDDRVVPAHSFKYAATLQREQGGSAPILIRIDASAGHGGGKPTSKRIVEDADILGFLDQALGSNLPTLPAYPVSIDQDRLNGTVDYSGLNHPLTAADRIHVDEGHFRNASGERIRFWGVNLAFGANFPEPVDAARVAKRLRRLGVNLVRLHHMDTSPDGDPTQARSILTTGPYPSLNPISVSRLRNFLDALSAEGIYVNLNLHVGYQFRPEIDQVPGPGPLPTHSKPLHIFYPRMVELQTQYATSLVKALRLKDDPVLAMVEINNETSLAFAWQAGEIDKYVTGEYRAEWDKQKAEFLNGREDSQDLTLKFIVDRDRAYLNRMRDTVRALLGPGVPIAGTQVEFGGPLNYESHNGLDYQDDHFYIDHYNFPNRPWDNQDWRIRDSSAIGSGLREYLNKAFARQSGLPYTVSEFNQAYPNRQAAEIDPTLAAFAAFQDWDGLMHFAYEHSREWDRGGPANFNLNGDVTKLPAFGQAAWIFRTGAVAKAKEVIEIPLPSALRIQSTLEHQQFNPARFLQSVAGVEPAIALRYRVAVNPNVDRPFPLPALERPYVSDTGELMSDPTRRIYTIAAPQVAGVFGFVGAAKTTAGAIDVELSPDTRGFAALLLTSRDDKPLEQSSRMLLSNPGYALPSKQQLTNYPGSPDRVTLTPAAQGKPSAPFVVSTRDMMMERVDATLTLRTSAKSIVVYPLGPAGERLPALPAPQPVPGGFRIRLDAPVPWYEITAQ